VPKNIIAIQSRSFAKELRLPRSLSLSIWYIHILFDGADEATYHSNRPFYLHPHPFPDGSFSIAILSLSMADNSKFLQIRELFAIFSGSRSFVALLDACAVPHCAQIRHTDTAATFSQIQQRKHTTKSGGCINSRRFRSTGIS